MVVINGKEYKVGNGEFNKINHTKFNNLNIIENVGLFERLISLMIELSEALSIENLIIYKNFINVLSNISFINYVLI